jgi:ribosomal-protein-alanine N-acetyltransferase
MIIKTKRFTIRPYRKGDLKSMVKHINDTEIARNTLTIPYPYTMKDAERWYGRYRNIIRRKVIRHRAYAIEINGEVVGGIGLSRLYPQGHKAEIGYWLGRAYRGKGIMTEAVKEITKFGFNKLGLRRLCACTFPHNKASMRVLEKAGYKFEGILHKNVRKGNRLIDEYLFAITR